MSGTYFPLEDKEERSPFLDENPQQELSRQPTEKWHSSRRSLLGVALVLAVVAALVTGILRRPTYQGFIPEFDHKIVTFSNNSRFAPADLFTSKNSLLETLRAWVEITAEGRGFLEIPQWERYNNLAEPYYLDPLKLGDPREVYMVSVFHQLHCLSQIMEGYGTVRFGGDMTEKDWHIGHCFDYLRQSIMCSADTTLEGSTEFGDGWGAEHKCKDYDQVVSWMNKRTVWQWEDDGHI